MENKKHRFEKLTPISRMPLGAYKDALEYVFANDDIKNVAISGAYSSGKSSVIEAYKAIHKEKKFIHISLAHFEKSEGNEESHLTSESKMAEKILEGKILNQLIHQIPPKQIPQTNFRVKKANLKRDRLVTISSGLVMLALIFFLANREKWNAYVASIDVDWLKHIVMWSSGTSVPLITGLICFVIFSLFAYRLINAQLNRGILKKISVQGTDIEILGENEDSYFDKYLNEVIYLFENSHAEVIVFEDMDRYNANRIFERLREVNTLVNTWRKRESEEGSYTPMRFFYLLRDDIFASKDRTKFFDFILPVVPVIDGSNSYEKIIELFQKEGIFDLFSDSFLKEVSLYIDDMRMLKNILNEFIIYHDKIQTTELNNNKLLAMVIYKNLFPRDFSELQLFQGYVHQVFMRKELWISKTIDSWNSEIIHLEAALRESQNEPLQSIDELDAIYLLPNGSIFSVAGQSVWNIQNRAELASRMKANSGQIQYTTHRGSHYFDVDSAIAAMEKNPEYVRRKKLILRKESEEEATLRNQIGELKKQIMLLKNASMKEVLSHNRNEGIFFDEMSDPSVAYVLTSPYHDLIVYLIRNGYLNEDYSDYMTYFYENSISRSDRIFLRSVTDRRAKGYEYQLTNPALVFSRLKSEDFRCEETLNYSLLQYMLLGNEIGLASIFEKIRNERNYDFIFGFVDKGAMIPQFIAGLNRIWITVIECLIDESKLTIAQKVQYILLSLKYTKQIQELNGHNRLADFISLSSTFLNVYGDMAQGIIEPMKAVGVKFKQIDYQVSNKDLFQAVYLNSLYEINWQCLALMIKEVYNIVSELDVREKNFTLIQSRPSEPLAQYVQTNMEEYLLVVLDNCGGRISDDETVVLLLLNDENITNETKSAYIAYLTTMIERLETITLVELWESLLARRIVAPSQENIIRYYMSRGNTVDRNLAEFLNCTTDIAFDNNGIDVVAGSKFAGMFFSGIVKCAEISDAKYEQILVQLNRFYSNFSLENIPETKMRILISNKIIRMTESNLLFMREHYDDLVCDFIEKNIDEYVDDIINAENFDFDEFLLLLSAGIDDEHALRLIEWTDQPIETVGQGYSIGIVKKILASHLHEEEVQQLFNEYPRMHDVHKSLILQIAESRASTIISGGYVIGYQLFSALLSAQKVDRDDLMEMLVLQMPNLNESQTQAAFHELGLNDFLGLFERKRPKFEVNPINLKILKSLKKKFGIRYEEETDKEGNQYYRGHGRTLFSLTGS